MSLAEFIDIFTDTGIFNESFGSKQILQQFAVSMMTSVDELDQERHMNMTFAEFMEAIVRVADQTMIPNLQDDSYTFGDVLDGTVTEQDKQIYNKRPLPQKIEALLYLLCQFHFPKLYKTHVSTVEKFKKLGVHANDIDTGNIKF